LEPAGQGLCPWNPLAKGSALGTRWGKWFPPDPHNWRCAIV
jgi:hypothetical protein